MNALAPAIVALNRSRWFLVQHVGELRRRFGVAGLVAVAGMVLAALLVARDRYLQNELRDVTANLAVLEHAHRFDTHPVALQMTPDDDDTTRVRERLHAFDAALPAFDDVGDSLNDILKTAERHHLKIVHGEYHTTSDDGADFARYEMSLPVSGDPAAIQALLAETLHAQKFLAVEHLRVQRSAQTPGLVDAQVRWVLFVRKPVSAVPLDPVSAASPPPSAATK